MSFHPSRTAFLMAALVALSGQAEPAAPRYQLVWADEFDRDGLPDATKWSWDTHANKTGWYNNELQYYAADRAENARVENGRLIITARRESLTDRPDHGGQRYTSARLITKGKAEWTYGMIEVRAKLPCGKGSWPAIWMLGATANWPDGGEIDIMEHVGKTPGDVARPPAPTAMAARSGSRTPAPHFTIIRSSGRPMRSASRSMAKPIIAIAMPGPARRNGRSISRNICCSTWRSAGQWVARSTMRSFRSASRSTMSASINANDRNPRHPQL